jgi:hypothetical protein
MKYDVNEPILIAHFYLKTTYFNEIVLPKIVNDLFFSTATSYLLLQLEARGKNSFAGIRMTRNGCEWIGNGWKWLGMAANGLGMARNGLGIVANGSE